MRRAMLLLALAGLLVGLAGCGEKEQAEAEATRLQAQQQAYDQEQARQQRAIELDRANRRADLQDAVDALIQLSPCFLVALALLAWPVAVVALAMLQRRRLAELETDYYRLYKVVGDLQERSRG